MPSRVTALKVYSWNYDGRVQCVVATTSWAKAAALAQTSPSHARAYGATTDNEADVKAAMAQPGVALFHGMNVPHANRHEGYCRTPVEAREVERALRAARP